MTNPPAANSQADQALTFAAAAAAVSCLLVWTATHAANYLATRRWADVTLWEAPGLVWDLATSPSPLSEQPAFYTILATLTIGTTVAAIRIWTLVQRKRDDTDWARWAQPRDLKPLLIRRPQPGRLTLGTVGRRLVATEAQHSVAVIGPAGTGKTTGFAIPALLEWDGPVIATSVKGDLLEATINHRQRLGETWVFDPTSSTGVSTAGWSPLHACVDWQTSLRMAAWLAATARAGERGGLQDSDFWYAVAQKLIAPLLYAAALSGEGMDKVLQWVDLQDDNHPNQILTGHLQYPAIQALSASVNREERTRSSAYTTAETVLAAFADPGVLETTTITPAINADRFLDGGNHTLYICGPLHEQARLRPLFTALIEQTIAKVYDRANQPNTRLEKPLLLVIDEAANIAPLPDLAQIASSARGVGIQLVTVWQDFAQIQARYGTFAPTVINNHRAKVVLSAVSDTPTLDYVSRLIGDQTTTEQSTTKTSQGGSSTTESMRQRALAPTATLRRSDTGTGVLIYGNHHPARLKLRPHFRRMRFTRKGGRGQNAKAVDRSA